MAKKTPIRTCIACGVSGDKRSFVRIVRTPEGKVMFDETGRMAGRGAYLCKKAACFETMRSKRLLDSRLRVKVDKERYEELEDAFRPLCQNDTSEQ